MTIYESKGDYFHSYWHNMVVYPHKYMKNPYWWLAQYVVHSGHDYRTTTN